MTTRRPVVQARALATRTKILDQAAIAIANDGYDAASLTGDILEPAGVSVGSFYHQFDNKLDVLFALLRERGDMWGNSVAEVLEHAQPTSLRERLRILIGWSLDQVDREPQLAIIQLRERWNPDAQVREAIRQGWAPWVTVFAEVVGTLTDDPEQCAAGVRMIGRFLTATLGSYLDVELLDRAAWHATELDHVVEFCAAGLEAITAPTAS